MASSSPKPVTPRRLAQQAANRIRDRAFRKRMAMKHDMQNIMEQRLKDSPEQQAVDASVTMLDLTIKQRAEALDVLYAEISAIQMRVQAVKNSYDSSITAIKLQRDQRWTLLNEIKKDFAHKVTLAFPDLNMNWHTVSGWTIPDDVKAAMKEAYDAELRQHP